MRHGSIPGRGIGALVDGIHTGAKTGSTKTMQRGVDIALELGADDFKKKVRRKIIDMDKISCVVSRVSGSRLSQLKKSIRPVSLWPAL